MGTRITDSVALDCAQEAAGQLRYEIEAAFSQALPNTPMAGATVRVLSGNFITARPVGLVDGIDFIHSGTVRKVDAAGIASALDMGALVLLSPFGFSPTGEAFNLAMEDVATATAIALQADKLMFLTEIPGHSPNRRRPQYAHRHRAPPSARPPPFWRGFLRQSGQRHQLLPPLLRPRVRKRCGAQPHFALRR